LAKTAKRALVPTPLGLHSPDEGYYIDPVRPVDKALITHGHADHARPGHGTVVATRQTLAIMKLRYGDRAFGSSRAVELSEVVKVGSQTISFHPAGHVLGSAQIRVEDAKGCIVVSGDYKRASDPTCTPFEPVPCDVFVTEATFGLPVFQQPEPAGEIAKLLHSLQTFPDRAHMVGAYTLGKAQRVIAMLRQAGHNAPIYIHGAVEVLADYYRAQGVDLGDLRPATDPGLPKNALAGQIIIAPPGAIGDRWSRRFAEPLVAMASGWMQIRQRAKQRGVELPLVVSDHVDWPDLTRTVCELNPEETWVTHGREDALVHWCSLQGMTALPLNLAGYDSEAD
jgi:putative mRNA 3-end processing factor